ncbi:MAG: hypothetical protein GY795_37155 [Desulfobacterales bacterium]|nr:hypothetical protein [Desulfobacterales bacterium]
MSKSKLATKLEKKLRKPKSVSDLAGQFKTEFLTILQEQGEFLEEQYDIENDEIQLLVNDAEEKLNESIEKSQAPLRVSMIGLFSSGKTVTLCSLLNKPRMLSSSITPTTGNVVEIQIVPPGQGEDSKQMKCVLFSQLELEAMLRDYYTWLAGKEKVKLSDLPEQPGFLRENINNLRLEVREKLRERWMQEAKEHSGFRSLTRLAHLYFILATIERYLLQYQEENSDIKKSYMLSLPYDPENEEAENRLKSVTILAMEWDLNMLHPDKLDKLADTFWHHTPDTFSQLYDACENGNIRTEVLRALLPLYKRIILTEEMELPGGWGEIDRIAFLDFPGVDSGSRRDVYLCLKELDTAHTNMLFFLADRPTVSQAQDLTETIAEARTHTVNLSDRIIPVINFFDAYPHDFESVAPDDTDPENALKRAEEFFAKEEVAGVERGFDIFERILGNLQLVRDWSYHLLTPVVGMDFEKLSPSEKKFRRDYEENLGNYGQLLKDIKAGKRELRKDKAGNKEKIAKYNRLQYALEAYTQDGGVGYLRETLGAVLRNKGARLIAEDARVPLIRTIERFEQEIISRLEDEDIEVDDDDAIEELEREEAKRNIIALWRQMETLTLDWTRQGERVTLEHKKDESSPYDEPVYISPLDLCESKVLERVLADKFWDALDTIAIPDDVQLSELAEGYRDMVKELDDWSDRALQDTIQHTLEKLEHTEILLETDEKVSFHGLRTELFEKYVNKARLNDRDKISLELKNLFSLSSEKDTLYNRLQERRCKEEEQQRLIAQSADNAKVPFNENLTFSWSPFEVMKIQRQIIITLQRQITSRFAFYISIFFNEFCQVLKKRLDDPETSIDSYFKRYNITGNLFDQLAEIPSQEDQEGENDFSLFERRKKAKEVATKIMSIWETLV